MPLVVTCVGMNFSRFQLSLPDHEFRASVLLERICTLAEYYLTQAELAIMHRSALEMGE